MKLRYGFISNSSSCSFTCPKCGKSGFGWDWDEDHECTKCGISVYDKRYSIPHIAEEIGKVKQVLSDGDVKLALKMLKDLCDFYELSEA